MSKNPFSELFDRIAKFDAKMSETPRAKTLEAMAKRFGEASSSPRKNPRQAYRGHHKL